MSKNSKIKIAEDSFVSSDCSIFESNIKKWCESARERLASKGKDISKLIVIITPDRNEGAVYCEDYTIMFNRDERWIDMVVNQEMDYLLCLESAIYAYGKFLKQFAKVLGGTDNFLYRFSTNISKETEYWYGDDWVREDKDYYDGLYEFLEENHQQFFDFYHSF